MFAKIIRRFFAKPESETPPALFDQSPTERIVQLILSQAVVESVQEVRIEPKNGNCYPVLYLKGDGVQEVMSLPENVHPEMRAVLLGLSEFTHEGNTYNLQASSRVLPKCARARNHPLMITAATGSPVLAISADSS